MDNFMAIMKLGEDDRVAKSMNFDNKKDADAFVEANRKKFPAAFVRRDAPGQASDLVVSPTTNRVTLKVKPPKLPKILSFGDFENRFTGAEWDAATNFIYQVDTSTGLPEHKDLIQELARMQARNRIALLSDETVAFMDTLATGEVITEARKTAIVAT